MTLSITSSAPLSEGGHPPKPKRDAAFWLIFVSLLTTVFLSAIDLTSVPTALPNIVADLNGDVPFSWVGSAYTLAASAWLPLSGALAEAFGRQPIVLLAIALFFVGSVICGEADNMGMLIAGRTVQGLGGGGILSLTEIIVADLVPLKERGLFMGLMALAWAFASAIGPPIGGAFAENVSWRWLFRLNLPLSFIAGCLVIAFLKLKMPGGTSGSKLRKVDWIGNALVVAATCAVTVALTRGGFSVPWTSPQTLVPLVLGLLGIVAFFLYEAFLIIPPIQPTIPFDLLTNRTSLAGFVTTFFHSIIATAVVFYMPIFFQACFGVSPIRAGIDAFALAFTVAPSALVGGVSAVVTKRYVPQNWMGWVLITIGTGVLSLLRPDTPTSKWVGFEILIGCGLGVVWTTVKFPILAPIPVERNASAMALFIFSRNFAQTFGITIGSAVLQNQLTSKLPAEFLALFPGGADVSFAAIPYIPTLSEPLRSQVLAAFADSMSVMWKVMLAFCFLGLITSLMMKEIELYGHTDKKWDLSQAKAEETEMRVTDFCERGASQETSVIPDTAAEKEVKVTNSTRLADD